MFTRLFPSILILTSSFLLVSGQSQDAKNRENNKLVEQAGKPHRDLPFPGGVDLQLLIRELARDMDINVLFDIESFRGPRRTVIDLKNVTSADALNYILLQEKLFFEEAGPRTILVASDARRPNSIRQIGVGVSHLTNQLAQYFGVEAGLLINDVLPDSPGAKAGMKAGDVIVEMDGLPFTGALVLYNAINDKKEGDVILKIVRERKTQTISLIPQRGIQ